MKTFDVALTAEALADLARIRTHIAQDDAVAAARVARELVSRCDRLRRFPERGSPGRVTGTREIASFRPYVIVYRVLAERVEILRIWHGAQDR
jgi:plasmid stabilization system protein ParE